jgi:hypothetical protein
VQWSSDASATRLSTNHTDTPVTVPALASHTVQGYFILQQMTDDSDPFGYTDFNDYDESGAPIYEQPDFTEPLRVAKSTHDDLTARVLSSSPQRRFPPDLIPILFDGFADTTQRDRTIARITDADDSIFAHQVHHLVNSNGFIVTVKLRPRLVGESQPEKAITAEALRLYFVGLSLTSIAHGADYPHIDNQPYDPLRDLPPYYENPVYTNPRSGLYPFGEHEEFLSRSFIPNDHNEPEYRPPAIQWFDQELAPVGSMIAIVASPGVGKSSTVEMAAESVITGEMRLGFQFAPETRIAIIDGEMTDQEVYKSYKRIKRRINGTPPYPVVFGTLGYSIPERRKFSEYIIKDLGYNLIIFDGGTDLIHDPNDLKETDEVINQWLRPMLNREKASAILTIHDNPDKTGMRSEKARGHFGAEVLRRSTGVLNIIHDRKTGVRTLSTGGSYGKFRHGDPNQSAYFMWDDQHKMMTQLSEPPRETSDAQQPKIPDLREIEYKLPRIFKGFSSGMLRSEIITRILSTFQSDYNLSNRRAEEVLSMAKTEGLIHTEGTPNTRNIRYFITPPKTDEL